MQTIDQLLQPFQEYSLAEFIRQAERLLAQAIEIPGEPAWVPFVRFMLAGRFQEGQNHQVSLDVLRNAPAPGLAITLKRDYDSMLGVCGGIRVYSDIYIYPVPRFEDTLKKDVYAQMRLPDGRSAPLHQIPNMALAKWGTRNTIILLFPQLATPERSNARMTTEELKEIYEKGIRPTIEVIAPEVAADWPARYSDEVWRASTARGQLALGTKPLGRWLVPDFTHEFRRQLHRNNVKWAEKMAFLHQIRGIKGATGHANDAEAAEEALTDMLEENSIVDDGDDGDSWWVDVGLEFSHIGDCMLWRTDSHYNAALHVLGTSPEHAARITKRGSSHYARDLSSHCTGISGCRIKPGVRAQGPREVVYMQMYTTEKAVTYSPDGRGHYGKVANGKKLLMEQGKSAYIEGLYQSYLGGSKAIDSAARIEVRVRLDSAATALVDWPDELLRLTVLAVPRKIWWKLRMYRLLAMSWVLDAQHEGPKELRVKPEAIALTAGLIWLMNGLHSRPDDGPSSREVMVAVLPHTDDKYDQDAALSASRDREDDNNEPDMGTYPYNPCGIIFLRPFQLPPNSAIPRMRVGRAGLSDRALQYYFNMTYAEIRHTIFPVGILSREQQAERRFPTSKRMTTTHVPEEPPAPVFDLAQLGMALPAAAHDSGSDLDENERVHERVGDIDAEMTKLWFQFLHDVMAKAPNPKGKTNESYCIIPAAERVDVQEELFRTQKLSEIWRVCQYRFASEEQWTSAFNCLWPPKGHVLSGDAQNYGKCQYYNTWKALVASMEKVDVEKTRRALKARVDGFYWLPFAAPDKMWNTKASPSSYTPLPSTHTKAAPMLLIRGRLVPEW